MTELRQKSAFELIKFVIYLVTAAAAVMMAYGAIDARVTTIEAELKYKVDDKILFERLEKLEDKILKKIESEFQKAKQ